MAGVVMSKDKDIESLLSGAKDARAAGHAAEARRGYEQAAKQARVIGDNRLLAHALRHISDINREDGRPAEALESGREAVELYRALPGALPVDLANALRITGLAQQDLGEVGEASSLWHEARNLYVQAGIKGGVEECDVNLSRIGSRGR
jgi:tetratricopeptide (TPR) repeat protein